MSDQKKAHLSDGQGLEKLAQVADKMADVTLEDIHIASVQNKDSHNNTESLADVMQCCLKISEKLDILIYIFKYGYAPASPCSVDIIVLHSGMVGDILHRGTGAVKRVRRILKIRKDCILLLIVSQAG